MITVNLDKAKDIAHNIRRALREKEFQPLDEKIAKQIPGIDTAAIEAERQAIREKYAQVQAEINSAEKPEDIRVILDETSKTA